MQSLRDSIKDSISATRNGSTRNTLKDISKELGSVIFELKSAVEEVEPDDGSSPVEDLINEICFSGDRCNLLLDDAVNVVRTLAYTSRERESTLSMANVENLVNKMVQKACCT